MKQENIKLLLIICLLILDACAVSCAIYSSFYLRFFILADYFPNTIHNLNTVDFKYVQIINLLIPIWLIIANYFKLYKTTFIGYFESFVRALKTSLVFIFICIVLSFSFKIDYSRSISFFIFIFTTIFIFIFRLLFKFICIKLIIIFNKRLNNILIGSNIKIYKDIFKLNPINKIYFYPHKLTNDMLDKIKNMILKKNIKQIILLDYTLHENELMAFYDWAEYNHIIFKVVPSEIFMCRGEINVDSSLGIPIFRLISDSMTGFDAFLKRSFDICISSLLLMILSPLIILIAILIKLESKGPVIYSQTRQGYRGKYFKFYKFRSMVQDADNKLKETKSLNLSNDNVFFKMKDDPRITKVGKFIRKYSIDELPQLFNVLKGDMSLVGPRPILTHEEKLLEQNNVYGFKKIFRVLPGITGLWQISGRSLLSAEKRIELDRFYVEHWSFALDIKILIKTFFVVVFHKGAF